MDSLKKILFVLLMVIILVPDTVRAQDEDSYTYESEFIWGVNKNTSGGLIGGLILKK